MDNWSILPTTLKDLDIACRLYDEAIDFQRKRGYPEYRWDDREMQEMYINTGKHFKLLHESEMVGMFNIQESDKSIWREMDIGDAIYLHGVLIHSKLRFQIVRHLIYQIITS